MKAWLFSFIALAACIGLLACQNRSTSAPAAVSDAGSCAAFLTGDFEGSETSPSCASFKLDDDGGGAWSLVVDSVLTPIGRMHVEIGLGNAPAAGIFSPETTLRWSAIASPTLDEDGGDAGCAFSAGSAAVPNGAFRLVLTTVVVGADGAPSAPHGSLDLALFVHSPPLVTCGTTDYENVRVQF